MTPDHLFVYGTLRKGGHSQLHASLARASTYVGTGRLRARLFATGPYPAAVPSSSPADVVVGEVYRLVDQRVLVQLDAYEGVFRPDPLYRREPAEIVMDTGDSVTAWAYFYNRPTAHLRRIPSGDFFRPS